MTKTFRVVIPVRYASTRLPGKALLTYQDKTILEHVYRHACASHAASVVIATDDERIAEAAQKFDAPVCMTRRDHQSGSDRISEAVTLLGWPDDDIIVNLQGDEPQMPAQNIQQVAALLMRDANACMATLCCQIKTDKEYHDPNVVKVVKNLKDRALYFSRRGLPYIADVSDAVLRNQHVYRHVGIYAYRVHYLKQFTAMQPSSLEQLEKLEQLRALENDDAIAIDVCQKAPGIGVDTIEDYTQLKAGQ